MTPQGLQAYGATYTAIARAYGAPATASAMTPAGLRAYGETYQQMAMSYLTADQGKGVPVQWHDVFTGAGVTIGAVALVTAVGFGVLASRRHRHPGRHTFAH
jgi:hypothetical protein